MKLKNGLRDWRSREKSAKDEKKFITNDKEEELNMIYEK